MEKKLFGILNTGEEIYEYSLENDVAKMRVITFGAAIRSFTVFDRDIIGGYDRLEDYLKDSSHQGAIIGRVANRIANAEFIMDGKKYLLPKNDGNNCLHGGVGFDRRVWLVKEATDDSITLTYTSKDGEEGFPANLDVSVTYRLFGTSFGISYEAIPDEKTPIALTNHAYFNLDGFGDTVLEHKVKIFAKKYTAVDGELIPTGEQPSVAGTVFDLRNEKRIGDAVSEDFVGYDHNFVLSPNIFRDFFGHRLGLCAKVSAKDVKMKVYTDCPGIQFYIGNFLGGEPNFKNNVTRVKHGAFCLETQTEPNCINRGVGFYESGEVYKHNTVYSFEAINTERNS